MGSITIYTETDTCRPYLAEFCMVGMGLDIGHGGAKPIVPWAICVDRPIGHTSRPPWDEWPTHVPVDAFQELPFRDNSFDFIYSSHCLEDADDTEGVLNHWCRKLKPGGLLVLFLPDQVAYVEHCLHVTHTLPNQAHKHADFSLKFVLDRLPDFVTVVRSSWPVPYNPYSFELVARKSL